MKADLILTGGSILTVDKNNSIHEAVAIINNKIAQVGSSEEILEGTKKSKQMGLR